MKKNKIVYFSNIVFALFFSDSMASLPEASSSSSISVERPTSSAVSGIAIEELQERSRILHSLLAIKKIDRVVPKNRFKSSKTPLVYQAYEEGNNFLLALHSHIFHLLTEPDSSKIIPPQEILHLFAVLHLFLSTKASVISKSGIEVEKTSLISMVPDVWRILRDYCLSKQEDFANYRTDFPAFLLNSVGKLSLSSSGKLSSSVERSFSGEFLARLEKLFHKNDDQTWWRTHKNERDYFNVPFNINWVLSYILFAVYVGVDPTILANSATIHKGGQDNELLSYDFVQRQKLRLENYFKSKSRSSSSSSNTRSFKMLDKSTLENKLLEACIIKLSEVDPRILRLKKFKKEEIPNIFTVIGEIFNEKKGEKGSESGSISESDERRALHIDSSGNPVVNMDYDGIMDLADKVLGAEITYFDLSALDALSLLLSPEDFHSELQLPLRPYIIPPIPPKLTYSQATTVFSMVARPSVSVSVSGVQTSPSLLRSLAGKSPLSTPVRVVSVSDEQQPPATILNASSLITPSIGSPFIRRSLVASSDSSLPSSSATADSMLTSTDKKNEKGSASSVSSFSRENSSISQKTKKSEVLISGERNLRRHRKQPMISRAVSAPLTPVEAISRPSSTTLDGVLYPVDKAYGGAAASAKAHRQQVIANPDKEG